MVKNGKINLKNGWKRKIKLKNLKGNSESTQASRAAVSFAVVHVARSSVTLTIAIRANKSSSCDALEIWPLHPNSFKK